MIASNQIDIKRAVTQAERQLLALEDRVRDLKLEDAGEQRIGGEATTEDLERLQQERKALDTSRALLEELLSKTSEEAIAKVATAAPVTTVTFSSDNLGLQAHTINGGVSGNTFGGSR
jgi:hypothetical protein